MSKTTKIFAVIVATVIMVNSISTINTSAKAKTVYETLSAIDEDNPDKASYTIPYNGNWTVDAKARAMIVLSDLYKGTPYSIHVYVGVVPDEHPEKMVKKFSKSKKTAIKTMNEYFAYGDEDRLSVEKDGSGRYMIISEYKSTEDSVAQYHIYRFLGDRYIVMYMVGGPLTGQGKYVPKSIRKLVKTYAKGVKSAEPEASSQP